MSHINDNSSSGIGCFGVVIIVLIMFWIFGIGPCQRNPKPDNQTHEQIIRS